MINQKEIVFVRILIPYAIGILTSWKFASSWLLYAGIIVAAIQLSALILLNLLYIRLRLYRKKEIAGCLFFTLWFSIGVCFCLIQNEGLRENHFSKIKADVLRIRIDEEPRYKNNIIGFKAKVLEGYLKIPHHTKSIQLCGKLMIALKKADFLHLNFNYGDEMLIRPVIKATKPPLNPAEFDYKFRLSAQNIYHQSFLAKNAVLSLHRNSGNPIWSYAIRLRARQVAFFEKVIPEQQNAAMASTLILGYKADLNDQIVDVYSKTGTIHALSVSGMHVGIVYAVLNWLLSVMDRKRILVILKVIVLLLAVWCYALLTGFSPAALRAVIMISVFIISKSLVRNTNSYNILAFAAFSLLIYSPFLIWDTGFQLSFVAVLGLIVLQPKIQHCLPIENKYLARLWGTIAVSLSAQFAVLPLSIYYFHQFPVYFLISNLFIMLPAALLMYIGLILLVFRVGVLAYVLNWLINFTNKGLLFITDLPGSGISGIWLSKMELFALSGGITAFVIFLYYPRKALLSFSLFLFLAFQGQYSFKKMEQIGQQKTLFFIVRKHHISACLMGETAVLFSSYRPLAKDFDYFIKPGLEECGISRVYWKIIALND